MKDKLIENKQEQGKTLSLYELLEYQNNHKLLPKIEWQDKPLTNEVNAVLEFYLDDFHKGIKTRSWSDSYTFLCFCKKTGLKAFFEPNSIMSKIREFAKEESAKEDINKLKDEIVSTFQILCVDIIYDFAKCYSRDKKLHQKYQDMLEQCANSYEQLFSKILKSCTKYATIEKDSNFLSSIDLAGKQIDDTNQTDNLMYRLLQNNPEVKSEVENILKSGSKGLGSSDSHGKLSDQVYSAKSELVNPDIGKLEGKTSKPSISKFNSNIPNNYNIKSNLIAPVITEENKDVESMGDSDYGEA